MKVRVPPDTLLNIFYFDISTDDSHCRAISKARHHKVHGLRMPRERRGAAARRISYEVGDENPRTGHP